MSCMSKRSDVHPLQHLRRGALRARRRGRRRGGPSRRRGRSRPSCRPPPRRAARARGRRGPRGSRPGSACSRSMPLSPGGGDRRLVGEEAHPLPAHQVRRSRGGGPPAPGRRRRRGAVVAGSRTVSRPRLGAAGRPRRHGGGARPRSRRPRRIASRVGWRCLMSASILGGRWRWCSVHVPARWRKDRARPRLSVPAQRKGAGERDLPLRRGRPSCRRSPGWRRTAFPAPPARRPWWLDAAPRAALRRRCGDPLGGRGGGTAAWPPASSTRCASGSAGARCR